jgi:hypothetical protein
MYDFYGQPPENRADLREYLTTWLRPETGEHKWMIGGGEYVLVAGFRRAFVSHEIFRNTATGQYMWYIAPPELGKRFADFNNANAWPIGPQETYENLLSSVIEWYYVQWGLTG